MSRRLSCLFLGAWSITAISLAQEARTPIKPTATPAGWTIRETLLGPIGGDMAVSPDYRHVARTIKHDRKELVLLDRTEGPPYDDVMGLGQGFGSNRVVFSPDSRRVAYLAKRDTDWRLVVDGTEATSVEIKKLLGLRSTRTELTFSADSSRWFFRTYEGFVERLVADGHLVSDDGSLDCVSQDGQHFAYLWEDRSRVKWLGVHGQEGKGSPYKFKIRTPSGGPHAYGCAFSEGFHLDRPQVGSIHRRVVDGKNCVFSADGRRLFVAAQADRLSNSCAVTVDGNEPVVYDAVAPPTFSSDGTHLAYPVRISGKWSVVVDGRQVGTYDHLANGWDSGYRRRIFFSPDGNRLAYAAKRIDRWIVVVDDVEGREYDEVGRPVFSSDSRRVAYRAKRVGKWFVVVDGAPVGREYDDIESWAVSSRGWLREELMFSPDGRRVVYRAQAGGKAFVVVDGQEGNAYDEVASPAFSSDGQHIAYAAKRKGTWVLVIDGVEGAAYDFLGDRMVFFDGPRQLHTLIRRGGECLLLEVEIPGGERLGT